MKRRKDGRWMRSITLESGKRVSFYSTAATETAANRDINRQIAAYAEDKHYEKHNFRALAEATLEEKYKTTSFSNATSYEAAMKVLSIFHDMDIEDIKPSMLQAFLNDMAARHYSFSSISKAKIFFGLVLQYATVKQDLPINNFMRSIKIPKNAQKGTVRSPNDEVIENIMKNVYTARFGEWAASLLCLGLRRGELAGLQRKDVNLARREVSLNHSVEFIGNTPHLKDKPKTVAGIRVIPIIDAYYPIIEHLCEGLDDENFLFGGDAPLTKIAIRRRWDSFCKDIGCDINGHQLRHAYAKLLYRAGVDPKTAQSLLGHADIQTTMNIYTDFDEEMTKKGGRLLNDFINSSTLNFETNDCNI